MTFREILLKIEIQESVLHQAFRKLLASHAGVGGKRIDAPFMTDDEQIFSNGDFCHLFQFGI